MTVTEITDPVPDWSQVSAPELCCPLCEYNLRGLEQPRCPECGFAFSWAELIRGQREKHRYLFEHYPDRNIWSFCKTYWNDCRPRLFWTEVNPAQPVRMRRLILYWTISNLLLIGLVAAPFAVNLWNVYYTGFPRLVVAGVVVPLQFSQHLQDAWYLTVNGDQAWSLTVRSLLVLAWPWLTLAGLLVFAQSMRKAKIKKRHVFRVMVYGCDMGLMLPVLLLVGCFGQLPGEWLLLLATVCAGLTLHRVYRAYSLYMRFHLPFATVAATQIMVFLVAIIVYLQMWRPW